MNRASLPCVWQNRRENRPGTDGEKRRCSKGRLAGRIYRRVPGMNPAAWIAYLRQLFGPMEELVHQQEDLPWKLPICGDVVWQDGWTAPSPRLSPELYWSSPPTVTTVP